jgi:hypothetical protein
MAQAEQCKTMTKQRRILKARFVFLLVTPFSVTHSSEYSLSEI